MAILLQLLVVGAAVAAAIWAIVSDLRRASKGEETDPTPHRKPWIHIGMLAVTGGMMLASSELALVGLGLLTSELGLGQGIGGLVFLTGTFTFLFGLVDKYILHRNQPAITVHRIRSVLHAFVAAFILLPLVGIIGGKDSKPGTALFTDQSGRYSIEAPDGWAQNPELLQQGALIGISDITNDLHVSVVAGRKEDLVATSLQEYAAQSSEQLSEAFNTVEATPCSAATLNGQPALQWEFHCTSGNVRLAFLIACVETPTHICEIRAWSTNSQFRENRQTLDTIVQSFTAN